VLKVPSPEGNLFYLERNSQSLELAGAVAGKQSDHRSGKRDNLKPLGKIHR
jgi:hypothetical protein